MAPWRSCAAHTPTRASLASIPAVRSAIAGVVAVLTAADFKAAASRAAPVAPAFVAEKNTVPERFPIAAEEAVFQGEPVAVVVAENRKLAPTTRRSWSRSTTSRCRP